MTSRASLARCLVFGLVVALSGCTKTIVEKWEYGENTAVDYAFVRPNVDFSQYTRLSAAPFEIYYPEGAGESSQQDLGRIRQIFRTAFLDAIGDDYPMVTDTGPNVLKVRASLIDLRTNKSSAPVNFGGRLDDIVREGHMTFIMELIDSRTDEVLARAADEEKPDLAAARGADDWTAVEEAAMRWAGLFRQFLDKNLGRP